ncbi:unnamed protein product [Cuscuta epithymum]|uniref:CLAVATA3/ESR (CLE)-related protein n=1 Tax=Cuscuta epithymum TaxID=186058 RepID=A0AAV0FCC3_9ASTE|nr:unnamed protein product [Cuscuta epithymum]CAH9133115.1 unnamed protein product [Cuscuta epithymum]
MVKMAPSKIRVSSLIFLAAICFFLFAMQSQSYDSKMGYQPKSMAVHEMIQSRKVLKVQEGEVLKVERELREAPMGPDPLHHHGGSPINRNNNLQPTKNP